jgi:hypothetical protein
MNELRYETSNYVNYGIVPFENLIMLNTRSRVISTNGNFTKKIVVFNLNSDFMIQILQTIPNIKKNFDASIITRDLVFTRNFLYQNKSIPPHS